MLVRSNPLYMYICCAFRFHVRGQAASVQLDNDDPESDDEDAPLAPRIAPVGFCLAPPSAMPLQAMLEPKAPEQQQLVG